MPSNGWAMLWEQFVWFSPVVVWVTGWTLSVQLVVHWLFGGVVEAFLVIVTFFIAFLTGLKAYYEYGKEQKQIRTLRSM